MDLAKVANRAQPKQLDPTNYKDLLSRLSDDQVRDNLGISDEREQASLRADPATYLQGNLGAQSRLTSLYQASENGTFTPDVDDKSNIFLKSLAAGFGAIKTGLTPVFKAIEWYDDNVADPTAGGISLLFASCLPGKQ